MSSDEYKFNIVSPFVSLKDAKSLNDKIFKKSKKLAEKEKLVRKLLLLGAGESGKSLFQTDTKGHAERQKCIYCLLI